MGSEIRDPGEKKIRIQDKHLGSAITAILCSENITRSKEKIFQLKRYFSTDLISPHRLLKSRRAFFVSVESNDDIFRYLRRRLELLSCQVDAIHKRRSVSESSTSTVASIQSSNSESGTGVHSFIFSKNFSSFHPIPSPRYVVL
jgi:hypothetical protein